MVIRGDCFMKTKIIYISGNEVFDAADIRTAFKEVRSTLGLSSDTVLFGVPVDSDDCGIMTTEKTNKKNPENLNTNKTQETDKIDDETVIPILSVLNTESDDNFEEDEVNEEDNIQSNETELEEETIESINDKIEDDDIQSNEIENDSVFEETIEIEEIINEEIDEYDEEKTLEQLLEKMTPLRADNKLKELSSEIIESDMSLDETNNTLEQLATEFASTQDEIVENKKSENTGKIGKLKNILPFKKAKREDSGLMGDLFGWAGIAANDDEFSMPDFFSNTASKK